MIGTNSRGKFGRHSHREAYSVWYNMLRRCYDKANKDFKYYSDVAVCIEWHDFQVFAQWFYDNRIVGYHLDKDKLSAPGCRMYSPSTCCFLSPEDNKDLAKLPTSGEVYCLESPEGELHYFTNQSEFSREYGLPRRQVSAVLDKSTTNKIVKGWSIPGTVPIVLSPEGTKYRVVNKAEFSRAHGLARSSFSDLLNGKRKEYSGWSVA